MVDENEYDGKQPSDDSENEGNHVTANEVLIMNCERTVIMSTSTTSEV